MNESANSIAMNIGDANSMMPQPESVEDCRRERKNKLAAAHSHSVYGKSFFLAA